MIERWLKDIVDKPKVKSVVVWLKNRSLPGFEKVPIFEVAKYFKMAVFEGTLGTRSASLAFNFFLAVFPGLLFLVSLIPFVPLEGFYDKLLLNLNDILPSAIKQPVLATFNDLVSNEREGLLIFNILLTLYFASNGVDNLMTQFNNTNLFHETTSWWKKRLIAIGLVLILTVLLFSGVILITFTKDFIGYFLDEHWLGNAANWMFVNVGRWVIVVAIFYFAISFLYYFGPAKRKQWKFFSVGSSTATVLIILTSLGFSYYVNHFSQYNAIYGSIGTIIIVMLYFQLNSFVLLLGFELNASIRKGSFDKVSKGL